MRISSKSFQMQWLASLNQQQARLGEIQQQIGSGKRIATAADDPAGAAQMILFQQGIARLDTYKVNADNAQRRLSLEEASLDQVTNVLDRIRELAVEAGGLASVASESRQAIANEIKELKVSLIDIANSQDGEGRYLFAGNRAQVKPFSPAGTNVFYGGDQGIRSQQISDDRLVQEGDTGAAVFQAIRNGNGVYSVGTNAANQGTMNFTSASVVNSNAWVPDDYTIRFTAPNLYDVVDSNGVFVSSNTSYVPESIIAFNGAIVGFTGEPEVGDEFTVGSSRNQDVFATAEQFIVALEAAINSPTDRAQYQSRLNNTLMSLEQSLDHIGDIRSQVGARLKVIDDQRNVNSEVSFQLEQSLSNVRDLDYASAISELQLRLLSLETAQKSFARTQNVSLFDFI